MQGFIYFYVYRKLFTYTHLRFMKTYLIFTEICILLINTNSNNMKKSLWIVIFVLGSSLSCLAFNKNKPDSTDRNRVEVGIEVSSFFRAQQFPFVMVKFNTWHVSPRLYFIPKQKTQDITAGIYKSNGTKEVIYTLGMGLQKNFRFSRGTYYLGMDYFIEKGHGYTRTFVDTFDRTTHNKGINIVTGIKIKLFDKVYLGPEIGYQFKWWETTDEYNNDEIKSGIDFGYNFWGLFITYVL